MRKSIVIFVIIAMIASFFLMPGGPVYAQGISLPAEINKSFSPISIAAGGVSRLSVTIFNPNGFPLTNASWNDNLVGVQSGLLIASPASVSNSCGGSVSAPTGGTTLSLSGGTVPAQSGATPGSCTVSINVTSTSTGNKINTIPAGELTSTGGGTNITNTTPASATLNVTGTQVPTVNKSFSPSTIWAGETSQLSIEIRNTHPTLTLTQASLTDSLPSNVFVASPVSSTLSGCGGSASVAAAGGGASVTLNNGSIAPNSTCTILIDVTSNVQGSYLNSIPANALQTQEGLTNAAGDTARLNVNAIGLSKAFSPSTVSVGGTTTLTITMENPTGSPYTGVNVTDNLPTGLTVVGVTNNTCGGTISTTSTSVSLAGGVIPAGSVATPGTCTISVEATVPAGTASGTLRNSIPAGALTTAQGVGNRSAANANLTVRGTNVTGSKSFSPSSIAVGENSRLRINIFAPGDRDLTNFAITDDLPAGVTVSNSSPTEITGCGPAAVFNPPTGATSISLTNGLVAAGQRCRIDVWVTSSTPGTVTNTIPPGNITNNEGLVPTGNITSNLTVGASANLSIALVKGFDPLTVFGGASSTMSIQLINPENTALTGIAFTDNMPSGMILATPVSFNVGTCGGALSGVPGANSFSFSGGSLPPSGTCTLTLSATMTVNGNLTNGIPAGAVTTTEGATNADPAEATLTNLPGASVGKFFSPNPIPAGSYSLLTITIVNTGSIGLTGLGLSDSLPAGLLIAGGTAPAPVNNCGGTFTAIPGTQLIQLTGGALAGNSSCTLDVPITGSNPGDFQNTIPAGALITDPSVNVTNNSPASDTLVITDSTGVPGAPPAPGGGGGDVVGSGGGGGGDAGEDGGGGGGGQGNNPSNTGAATVANNTFLIPVTGFAPGRVTKLDASSRPIYGATSLSIEIPVLKVKTSIVGVESNKGKWDVSWLQDQVGWLNGTAYPTWKGNSVLTAHVANADGKPGLFSRLKALGVGEYVFVYNSGYRYTYKVVSNAYVRPNDSTVMKHEEKSYLTLITCDTYDEKTSTYLRRVVVRAMLVDVREIK